MSFVQYSRGLKDGPGVFLAVAAYDGLSAPFVHSLFASQAKIGCRLDLEIFAGNCHVDDSRNRLVRDFLETDCEQLVFLDTDVFWLESDLERLIRHEADIVAGIYPLKNDEEDYPVAPLPGERWSDACGLVEVAGVPTGFLKVRRRVFEKLYPTVAHHRSKEDGYGRLLIPVLFERALNGVSRRGGDYEFCRKAREAGFKVHVDPLMQLGHEGKKLFTGCVGHYWRRDVALPEGLRAISEGRDGPETYLELFNVWQNNYALTPEALYTAVLLARRAEGPILDCGAGLSTLCLGAASKQRVISLESFPMWASRVSSLASEHGLNNVEVRLCGVKQYHDGMNWYDTIPQGDFSLVLCDGIPRRSVMFSVMRDQIAKATILVDDIERDRWRQEVDAYCAENSRSLTVFEGVKRPFGLIQ